MLSSLRGFTLVLTLCGATAFGLDARDLNAQGLRMYKQGKFPEALDLFKAAIAADDGYALAHYNYAATLGVLRAKGDVCSYGAYKAEIIAHLKRSIALDPRRRERMKTDADFDTVKDTVGYQRLLGKDPGNPADVKAIVEQVSWFGVAPGAYGPMSGADFKPNGQVELWVLTMDPDEGTPKREKYRGTWSSSGATVKVRLDRPLDGKSALEGTLSAGGELTFPAPVGKLTDDPAECDA